MLERKQLDPLQQTIFKLFLLSISEESNGFLWKCFQAMKFPEGSPIYAHSNSAYGMKVCQSGAHLITCAKYAYYEELLSTKNSWSAKYGLGRNGMDPSYKCLFERS